METWGFDVFIETNEVIENFHKRVKEVIEYDSAKALGIIVEEEVDTSDLDYYY